MFWFKSCPRCDGDLTEQQDVYGRYVSCLQCGRQLTEAEEVLLRTVHSYRLAGTADEPDRELVAAPGMVRRVPRVTP